MSDRLGCEGSARLAALYLSKIGCVCNLTSGIGSSVMWGLIPSYPSRLGAGVTGTDRIDPTATTATRSSPALPSVRVSANAADVFLHALDSTVPALCRRRQLCKAVV